MNNILGVILTLVLAVSASLVGTEVLAHGSHKKVCKKNGKVIKAKGKTDEAKMAACEAKGGEWVDDEE